MERLLAASLALLVLAPGSAPAREVARPALSAKPGARPGTARPALELARRMLAGKGRTDRDLGLVTGRIAGLLEDGLDEADLARAARSPELPRGLPLAPELAAELESLVAAPYPDGAVFARIDRLAPALASLVGYLHAENEGYLPYRILLGGRFAEGRLSPRDGLEVWLDGAPGHPAARASMDAAESWNGIVAEAMQRFARIEGLELHRYGATARVLESQLEKPVDLGLGLDLLADPAQALREHFVGALRAHGVRATRAGRILATAAIRPRGGYVERHIGELARRFDRMRLVLAEPLAKALGASGPARRELVAAAGTELELAVDRFGAYLAAWQRNLVLLEGMAQGKPLDKTAARLGMPVEALRDPVALLARRVRPEALPALVDASRSPLARLVGDLRIRLEGYAARYRQALSAGR